MNKNTVDKKDAPTNVAEPKPVAAKKPGVAAKKAVKPATKLPAKKTVKAVKKVAPKKVAPAKKAAPTKTAAAENKDKVKKAKLVRDSFTMPEAEYNLLGEVKKACVQAGFEVKKSELLRVGVALVKQMEVTKLKAAVAALPALKAGRPKKEK
jgi:hypothetical protein